MLKQRLFVVSVGWLLGSMALASSSVARGNGVDVVCNNFDNPCGIAVHPKNGHLFVSAHKSVFRVVLDGSAAHKSIEIDGFESEEFGGETRIAISALGLAFLNDCILAVGGGGQADGSELVYFYQVSDEPKGDGEPIKASATLFTAGPIKPGVHSQKGEGNFFALVVKDDELFVTCNGADSNGLVAKIKFADGSLGPMTPFIRTKEQTGVDAPTGAAFRSDGKLVVSQLGKTNVPGDSVLAVYDPATGTLEKSLSTGLNDLLAIAYSPTTGKLYGLDFSWLAPEKGGLFLLEPGESSVRVVKIADLDRPTAMAFADDGSLYITVLGGSPSNGTPDPAAFPGKLLAIGGL